MKNEKEILRVIKKFRQELPKFPDGRINYRRSKEAPVLNVFLKYKNKILILKRSGKVLAYKEKWNSIGGFLDEVKPVGEKVLEETKEETGIDNENIIKIKIEKIIKYEDVKINRIWLIVPVLVELKEKPEIELDWEHDEYKWIRPEEIRKYDTIPDLDKILNSLLGPGAVPGR